MVTVFILGALTVQGQERDKRIWVRLNGNQYEMRLPGDPTWKAAGVVTISKIPGLSEDVVFRNVSGGAISVVNTSSPDGLKPDVNIPDAGEGSITFTCAADEGTWVFDVGDGGGAGTEAILTVEVICRYVPTLTPYGLGVLILLLIVSTIWVLRRQRAVA